LKEFKQYSLIDDASREFSDPVTLSRILLNQTIIVINKKDRLINCLREIKKKSIEALKEKNMVYMNIRSENNQWSIRGLLIGGILLSLIYEDFRENVELHGSLAYDSIYRNIYVENPIIRCSLGLIPLIQLPDKIKDHAEKAIHEVKGANPPHIWLNKYLYDIFIEDIISDKGAYMHVLRGRDKFNRRYAVKIPREKTIDGKPLAVNSEPSTLAEVLKGVMNSLEVSLITRDNLKKGIVSHGYDEVYADQLIHYRKYILRPKAIIVLRNTFTREEYYETPPLILEDYADLGDLDQRIRSKQLNHRELCFIAIRLAGALAIIHASHFIHMDIKPQNVLLLDDESEPYGYAPLIGDFVGSPHIFDSFIELKKSTPEYADPLSLIKGRATYSYDVYSLGATLYYAVTRKKLRGRTLFNLIALKDLYGLTVPLKAYLVENPDLTSYSRKIESIFREFKSKKKVDQKFIDSIISIINEVDHDAFEELDKKLPEQLTSIVKKMLILSEDTRYRDSIALWIDLVGAIKELGFSNLIPSKTYI